MKSSVWTYSSFVGLQGIFIFGCYLLFESILGVKWQSYGIKSWCQENLGMSLNFELVFEKLRKFNMKVTISSCLLGSSKLETEFNRLSELII